MGEAGQEAEEGDEPEITRETKRNISRGSNGRSSLVEVAVQVATIRALGGSCSRRGKASKGEPWLPTCRGVPPDAERRLAVPAVWLRFQYCRLDRDRQTGTGTVRVVRAPGRSTTPLGPGGSCGSMLYSTRASTPICVYTDTYAGSKHAN
jgi:hypothetical protein